jgi:hypothetical protein
LLFWYSFIHIQLNLWELTKPYAASLKIRQTGGPQGRRFSKSP